MLNIITKAEEVEAMSDQLLIDYWNALLDALDIVESQAEFRGLIMHERTETEH